MGAFLDGVLGGLLEPGRLLALATVAIAVGGLRLAVLKHRREDRQAAHAAAHARAAIAEALRRKLAEREALLYEKERSRQDIEDRRVRVITKFRRDCSTERARMARQGVIVDHRVIEAGTAGLARAQAEDALNLEVVKHEHDFRQGLAAIDLEIEILKDKLAVERARE